MQIGKNFLNNSFAFSKASKINILKLKKYFVALKPTKGRYCNTYSDGTWESSKESGKLEEGYPSFNILEDPH